ncbi:MAG: hypothetical protein ACRDST_08185 [Pseudonocardiaceae bacterium]
MSRVPLTAPRLRGIVRADPRRRVASAAVPSFALRWPAVDMAISFQATWEERRDEFFRQAEP